MGRVELTWNDVAGGADAYEVQERRPRKVLGITVGHEWQTIWQAAGSPITITGLEYGVSYRHRIRAVRGSQASAWVEATTPVPLPYVGHQPDHAVRYALSGIPTPSSKLEASRDPGVVIPTAVALAATAWNSVGSPPGVLFCEGSACGSQNTDGRTIPVSVVPKDFGPILAYMKPTAGWADSAGHLKDMKMGIEHPAYRSRTERVVWTNNYNLGGTRAGPGQVYEHLPTTVMHEFGHAAGLYDLYLEAGIPDEYPGYLMGDRVDKTKIVPAADRAYLRDTYRGHSRHGGR